MAASEGRREPVEPCRNQKHKFLHPVVKRGRQDTQVEGRAVRHPKLGDNCPLSPWAPRPTVSREMAQRHRPLHCQERMDPRGGCIHPTHAQQNWL